MFLAKSATVVAAMAAFALCVLALVTLAMWPALALHGAPLGPNDPTWASLAGAVGRGVALAAVGAAMGFAIATIGRNTAAALGAGFAYVVVLENILGNSVAEWRRWLLLGNIIVFVSGTSNGGDVPGRSVTGAGCSWPPWPSRSWSERPQPSGAATSPDACGRDVDGHAESSLVTSSSRPVPVPHGPAPFDEALGGS